MKRFAFACLLALMLGSEAHAQFDYPLSPATYRIYYADDIRDQIRTCTLTFSPLNDAPWITADELLYTANNPAGLASCGDDLYWVETGAGAVYRGKKDASVIKTSIVIGLGSYGGDLLLRGGALYIADAAQGGKWGILKADLSGNRVGFANIPVGVGNPDGIEKAAMNFLVKDYVTRNIYSFNFNTGATQLLTTIEAGGFDMTVADTSLVWAVSSGGSVEILKRSLGGGGAISQLYSGACDEARYLDALDNRIFLGFTFGANSYLGVCGVRGIWGGSRGIARNVTLTPNTGLRGFVVEKLNMVKNDFDGDGLADRSVYYPATGQWYIYGTATGFYTDQFGYPGTIPVPGDYDGDGTTDYGIFDPATGVWQIFRSSLGYYTTIFGGAGMMPSISDYDNDGKSDICIYNPPTGRWYIQGSLRGYFEDQFGNAFMIPVDTQTRTQP